MLKSFKQLGEPDGCELMQDIFERKATYADLEAVPPHLVAELLCGKLVTHPRPAPAHAVAAASLTMDLGGPYQKGRGGPGGWIFMTEPELHFGEDVTVPELACWKLERMSAMPPKAYIEVAPDWLCEVLSPSTEKYDRGDKREIYARAGVRHLWLLDPRIQCLEAFALTEGRWLLLGTYSGDQVVRIAPFEDVEIQLAQLWPLG